jgi:hypothetical protein
MLAEFRWISQECPNLASYFTSWIDVQELVSKKQQIGLVNAIIAMQITYQKSTNPPKTHRSSSDTVRCLAVLFGLFRGSFNIPYHSKQVLLLRAPPKSSYHNPFTARITTVDGSFLPTEYHSPRALANLFKDYDLKPVAFNTKGFLKNNSIRVWWVSMETMEDLEKFVAEIHGSPFMRKVLLYTCSLASEKFAAQ